MNDKFVDMPKCMADKYETADFIASDPVQFPRRYSGRDAEVSGFITSWLSFGNRKAIIGAAEMRKCLDKMIEDIARESMNDLVENASEKKYRFRLDYMDEELTVDEFIRGRMKKVVDSNIETMVESKAKSFVNELRKRYDMAFAAFVVDSMRKQNMLKDEKIAELLKDNPDER